MNLRFSLLLALFASCALTSLRAQDDLRNDAVFFQEQAQTYQRWLDKAGLGQYLRFRELDVREQELDVYLEFPFNDLDLIVNAWGELKENFEANSPLTLEQQLFYKAAALLEVPQSALSVQLYDTYEAHKEPLFLRAIYFDEGRVRVEESNPKAAIRPIRLEPRPVSGGKPVSVAEFQAQLTREKAYRCILDYARERYQQAPPGEKVPQLTVLEDEENLRFEVIDLRKEVLNGANPCDWLATFGFDCNWAKRELLIFTFSYEKTLEGIRLTGDIDGKVGSGFYANVRRGGYLSMEIDFDEELRRYSEAVTVEIRNMLRNCR